MSEPNLRRPLEGKVAIVTGGSRGIGAAICRVLACRGCSIVLNYISDASAARAESLAAEIRSKFGVQCINIQADMASETGPQSVVDAARNAFDPELQIDIIVNNAGFSENFLIEDCDAKKFAQMYNLNTRGPLLLMKAALPFLPHDRSGRIVNVSSVSSSFGAAGQSIYGGTKAALESMTRTWSRELAERATVNAINPGPVATDLWDAAAPELKAAASVVNKITPLAAVRSDLDSPGVMREAETQGGRPARVEEIAALVALLCSSESSWSTGSVLCANGGMRFTY